MIAARAKKCVIIDHTNNNDNITEHGLHTHQRVCSSTYSELFLTETATSQTYAVTDLICNSDDKCIKGISYVS